MISTTAVIVRPFIRAFNTLKPIGDLLARIWVAYVFFLSGLVKVQSWQATVMLFQHVYHVPFMSPYFAAVSATAAELILPVLLVLFFLFITRCAHFHIHFYGQLKAQPVCHNILIGRCY